MKLSEKILYCRQKAGLSQEALADILGISRQAVSKWETGVANPEVDKLLLLSKAFDVSTDWLLSEDGPQEETINHHRDKIDAEASKTSYQSDYNNLPNYITGFVKKYGWLAGIYISLWGLGGLVLESL